MNKPQIIPELEGLFKRPSQDELKVIFKELEEMEIRTIDSKQAEVLNIPVITVSDKPEEK